jgi:hypothetical protein
MYTATRASTNHATQPPASMAARRRLKTNGAGCPLPATVPSARCRHGSPSNLRAILLSSSSH